ncbi:hypothetical protein COT52_02325 [candidate division WWE3 bacterium CG08_land_8_20_14_0_20_43_13]|uniref:YebC/PmpR family DNA-binding transcriptional regulator n=1 Tax=candidate division WWE3 bacterium CG08_land_8_20_14_0_20_43_13 TaxID=1975087 RepID=A0A2H0X948_UNCKA|nr:MAG: hypothetical protein COT52_02325 [candidate division WWE3 bacterium CG08_land_8_20_14_0_20_43_13]
MSGHSKWATNKHKKAAQDAKRGQAFTKVGKMIMVAVKDSIPPGTKLSASAIYEKPTASIEAAIAKAKSVNMPKDNIIRAIERAVGGGEGSILQEVTYEGYGPEAVAYVVKAVTDNSNRTVAELRRVFEQHGGRMVELGSASYIFANGPDNPTFEVTVTDPDKVRKVIALADALEEHDDVSEVWANFDVPEALIDEG